jgi:hypothetical protein
MAATVHYFLTEGSGPEHKVTRAEYARAEQQGFPTLGRDDQPQHMAFTVMDRSGRIYYEITADGEEVPDGEY